MHRLVRASPLLPLVPLMLLTAPGAGAAQAGSQEAGTVVGSIQLSTADGSRMFQVLEGSPREGFATGFNEQPMGEAMALTVSLDGREEGGGAELLIQTGVFQASMAQVCDPMTNNVELHPGEAGARLRLRPGGSPPATCPENTVDVEVTEATFDRDAGTLHLVGTFSGPLGQGDDALQVSEGRFEATVHSFRELM